MPRGKFTSHKGRNRKFTSPEELEEERRKEEQQTKWRKQHGDSSSEEEEEAASGSKDKRISEEGSSSEEETSSDEEGKKAKGVSNLIEIENPNRIQKKSKKLNAVTTDVPSEKPQLSRREREEIEKQRAQAHYQKLHAEGKTDQARADLARLAIIKQQREDAQKRREVEKKELSKDGNLQSCLSMWHEALSTVTLQNWNNAVVHCHKLVTEFCTRGVKYYTGEVASLVINVDCVDSGDQSSDWDSEDIA